MKRNLLILTIIAIFSFVTAACEKEGSAEKAGKAIDDAVEQAKEKIEDAGE